MPQPDRSNLVTRIAIKDRSGKKIGEKEVARYGGLLAQAHSEGLKRITTKLVQVPDQGNGGTAIVHAEVETEKGVFDGIGDANTGNVSQMVAAHLIRMAETRAKARALRDAVNIGVVSLEEIGSDLNSDELVEPDGPTARTSDPEPPVRTFRLPSHEPASRADATSPSGAPASPSRQPGGGNGQGGNGGADFALGRNAPPQVQPFGQDPMTDAQRRYLFRLVADHKGLEGAEARDFLKQQFSVTNLGDVSKGSASRLIEALVNLGPAVGGPTARQGNNGGAR